jgi:hypothetical protein
VEDGPLLPYVVLMEGKERTIEDLISFFFHSLYSWSAALLAPLTFSFNDFLVLFSTSS